MQVNGVERNMFWTKPATVDSTHDEEENGITVTTSSNPAPAEITLSLEDYLLALGEDSNPNVLFEGYQFRTSDTDQLIVPADVYEGIKKFTGNDPFEFGKFMAGDNADTKEINYFAAWFIQINNNEGGIENCVNAANYGKDTDINKLIESGRITVEQVTISSDGKVVSSNVDNVNKQEDEIKDVYEEYADKEYAKINSELNEILDTLDNMTINSEKDYNMLISKLIYLESLAYNVYNTSLDIISNNNTNSDNVFGKDLISDAEKRYEEAMQKIDVMQQQLDHLYEIYNKKQHLHFKGLFMQKKY